MRSASFEQVSIDRAPTVIMDIARGKATKEQIIILVLRVQLSMALKRRSSCKLDVLCGQPIKLIQVASTSELLENQRNDLVFFKMIPSHFFMASEASKIDSFKN